MRAERRLRIFWQSSCIDLMSWTDGSSRSKIPIGYFGPSELMNGGTSCELIGISTGIVSCRESP